MEDGTFLEESSHGMMGSKQSSRKVVLCPSCGLPRGWVGRSLRLRDSRGCCPRRPGCRCCGEKERASAVQTRGLGCWGLEQRAAHGASATEMRRVLGLEPVTLRPGVCRLAPPKASRDLLQALLRGLWTCVPCVSPHRLPTVCACHCVPISPSPQDTGCIGLRPPLVTSLYLDYSPALRCQGLGLYRLYFRVAAQPQQCLRSKQNEN